MAAAALLLCIALARPADARSAASLAERLAAMRAEVEELSGELTHIETDSSAELRSLARQKADLEAELEREKVRAAKLRSSLETKRAAIAERSKGDEDLAPIFAAALAGLRRHVEAGLPFRAADRLAELDKIETLQKSGVLSTERALVRLWSFVDDELRMTRESGLFRQTISLEGRELLAEVVRVGMVAIYFRTSDGAVGETRRTGDGWRFTRVTGAAAERQIRDLFDSFKKQIRVGFFHLPDALPEVSK